nr:esterase [Phaedon brassicae]
MAAENPEVKLEGGRLKGGRMVDLDGNGFYCFLGIPYAKPPVGQLRFKAPEPAEPWEGVLDATKDGSCCYQRDFLDLTKLDGSEDCLNLNVYTKTLPSEHSSPKPVMVYIHGGAFTSGSNKSTIQGPHYLMTEDVVLVVINYRLAVLGFLSAEDDSLDVPGNAGLKDQTLALKWVQRNIAKFNGDPGNVTIFGISAGGASVHYQVMSPTAKGLFHKAICQSGSVLNPWPYGRRNLLEFTQTIDENVKTEKEALEVLRKVPIEKLYEYQEKYRTDKSELGTFAPIIEHPNPTAFITKHPIELITSGQYNKVPLIFSYCSNEGLLIEIYDRLTRLAGKIPKETGFDSFFYNEMNLDKDSEVGKQICQMLSEFYTREDNLKDKFMLPSDFFFVAGIIAAVINHVKTSENPVYLYKMSYVGNQNLLKKMFRLDEYPGACHGDDMTYIFKCSKLPIAMGEDEEKTIRRFTKLLTNFARNGNPTPSGNNLNITWQPADEKTVNFLDIDKDLEVKSNPESDRIELWRKIFKLCPATSKYL